MKKTIAAILAFLVLSLPCWGALDFISGNSEDIAITDNGSLDLQAQDFSIMAWMKWDILTNTQGIFNVVTDADNGIYFFWIESDHATKPGLSCQINYGAGDGNKVFGRLATATWTPNIGQWYHIVITFDKSADECYFYVDGAIKTDQGEVKDLISGTGTNIHIASRGGSNYFDGGFFDVRVYNRMLTDSEIATIYAAQGNDCIVSGLKGWWRLDEKPTGQTASGANTIRDLSGNVNHGTPANTPTYEAVPMAIIKPIQGG